MRNKKFITLAVTLTLTLAITGCSGKSSDTNGQSSATQPQSSSELSTESTNELTAKLDDLYQQENLLFSEHSDAWNKAFSLMNKDNSTADQNMDYADFLSSTIESAKDQFTDEQLAVLRTDIEEIRSIEKNITEIQNKLSEAGGFAEGTDVVSKNVFPGFTGKDLDGNDVDDGIFSENAVTVLNFWFNGCKPCVEELSKLNELNETIKSMGGELIGINTETLDGNKTGIEEAKALLESKNATYRNIYFDSDSEAGKYASGIMAFPTTILVDRHGNIIGEPFLGGVDNQENYDNLLSQIQEIINADSAVNK